MKTQIFSRNDDFFLVIYFVRNRITKKKLECYLIRTLCAESLHITIRILEFLLGIMFLHY